MTAVCPHDDFPTPSLSSSCDTVDRCGTSNRAIGVDARVGFIRNTSHDMPDVGNGLSRDEFARERSIARQNSRAFTSSMRCRCSWIARAAWRRRDFVQRIEERCAETPLCRGRPDFRRGELFVPLSFRVTSEPPVKLTSRVQAAAVIRVRHDPLATASRSRRAREVTRREARDPRQSRPPSPLWSQRLTIAHGSPLPRDPLRSEPAERNRHINSGYCYRTLPRPTRKPGRPPAWTECKVA